MRIYRLCKLSPVYWFSTNAFAKFAKTDPTKTLAITFQQRNQKKASIVRERKEGREKRTS